MVVDFSTCIVDKHIYQQLKELINDSEFMEVIDSFRHESRQAVNNLNKAVMGKQPEYIGAICHKLKSSSRLVGALAMARYCEQLEAACESGLDNSLIINIYHQLAIEAQRVETWLEAETRGLLPVADRITQLDAEITTIQ